MPEQPQIEIEFQGRRVMGTPVTVKTLSSSPLSYELEDGTKLDINVVVNQVLRLDAYNEHGEPIYAMKQTVVSSALVPPRLKKRKDAK